MISVQNLSKSFDGKPVLQNLSFEVADGEKIHLSAPSGVGKTTLLRILAGLESADKGTVTGVSPNQITFLFQEPRLFPQLTALENVTCVHADSEKAKNKALQLLEKLGLSEAVNQYPDELSGGMKQRVALARTLSVDRPVVFLDEPFTALDSELKDSVRKTVAEFCEDKTLILVSHDSQDAEILTRRTLRLD